jgi:uncharacterized protein (UPF0332 family)
VRPETSGFLDKAREFLLKAEDMFADDWPDEAGRAAYLAGLHAAQAVIVERTGRIIRRHRGVRNELRRLLKDEPRFDLELQAFLGRAYNLKAIADYETGPGSRVSDEVARVTIETARRYVEVVAALLAKGVVP